MMRLLVIFWALLGFLACLAAWVIFVVAVSVAIGALARGCAPAQPPSQPSVLGHQRAPHRPHPYWTVTPTGLGRTPTWERHGRARGAAGKAGRAPGPCYLEN